LKDVRFCIAREGYGRGPRLSDDIYRILWDFYCMPHNYLIHFKTEKYKEIMYSQ